MRSKNILSRMFMVATLFAAIAVADLSATGNTVCIHLTKGQKLVYTHENHPMIVFSGSNNVTIKSDHKEVSALSIDGLHKITFTDPAGIGDAVVDSKGQIVNIGPSDFALTGFDEGTTVSVVSLGGMVMQTASVDDSSAFIVSLDGYAKGVYIIVVGTESYKVALK
ncbi:MAG: hypothetical protein K2I89_00805 [Muribaculaceae bacterium]|nr:hypothetical protein [Muribaculaceae bacterium]